MEHAWCHDIARDAAVRAAEDNRTGPLPTLGEAIASPFVEAAERSVPVSKTGEGQSGMRTERVVLEITHDLDARLSDWIVEVVDESLGLMESVRVVEDDRVLAASKKLIEVDQEAALRGFDTTTFQRLWISAIARVLGLELARPPRSKCDNPGDGSIPSPGILASPALVEAHQQIAALTAERDSAIRERDTLRAERITQALTADRFASAVMEADTLRARVAELEAAAKLAPDANDDGGSNHAAQAASGGGEQGVRDGTLCAPAGDSGQASRFGSGEPVAWGCDGPDGRLVHVSTFKPERDPDTVVPLYREPPQPRGWLTEQEIDAVADAADTLSLRGCGSERRARILRELLARSSPPEVVLPTVFSTSLLGDRLLVEAQVKDALAAAGVAVKEVGRG